MEAYEKWQMKLIQNKRKIEEFPKYKIYVLAIADNL